MDLLLFRQDRLIDFLRRRGRTVTRDVATAMDWPIRKTQEELERLERFRKIESHRTLSNDAARGLTREWTVID